MRNKYELHEKKRLHTEQCANYRDKKSFARTAKMIIYWLRVQKQSRK